MFKFFMKLFLSLVAIVGAILLLAYISINRNPIGTHMRKFDNDKVLFQTYEQDRSESERTQLKKNFEKLATTGSCSQCDFDVRKLERENKDLYNAIKRAKDKGLAIDLSGTDMFFAELKDVDLSGANLTQIRCVGANLEGANLSGANLKGAILSGAKLQGANLKGADLTGAELAHTKFSDADLTGAKLHEALLSLTNLTSANMTNVDLTNAVIYDCVTNHAKFIETDFRGARIMTKFANNADLTGAKFDGWIMRSFNTLTFWLLMIMDNMKSSAASQGEIGKQ
jgi:uncharacterized protein YjbI with pentapeptide repeats